MILEFPLMAALLSPGLLYAGAAATAAPILIHLLARRRFTRIRWAAMEFLIDAERRNRRRLRMEEWILLALRCLALTLIGLALARPFLDPTGLAASLRGTQRTERVFVLDDSFSMAYASADGTPFDRAKRAIRRIIELVRRETPDDTVTLVRMTDVEHPIDAGTYLDDTQTPELLARLEALSPTQRASDPEQVVRQLAELFEQAPGMTNAAVYVLSDFQRYNWAFPAPSGGDRSAALFAPLRAWATNERRFKVVMVNVGGDDRSNLAVTSLAAPGGQLVTGAEASLRAEIGNYSQHEVDAIELHCTVGNLIQPAETLEAVPSGRATSVALRAAFPRPGFDPVRVRIPADALPIDNVRYLAAEVVPAIRVLIVNGEPSPDPFDDEVTFLTTALRPEGDEFSGNELTVVDEGALGETNLEPFHLVVLANVFRLSDPVIEALEGFVRGGGGLVIFVGDQVDADQYNASLYRDGAGLAPARLTEIIRPSAPVHLMVVDRLHPALRGLCRDGDPLGLGQVPFFAFMGSVPYAGADQPDHARDVNGSVSNVVAATRDETPLTSRPARVLARFDDADEQPAMVERSYGSGRVVLITTSADKGWSAWPDHPTYLPVVMELSRYAARRGDAGPHRIVGDPIELALDPNLFARDAVLRTPSFPDDREVSLTGQTSEARGLVFTSPPTRQAGFYRYIFHRRDGAEDIRLVAVNVDARESDLSAATEVELRRAAGDVPLVYIDGVDKIAETAGEARTEVWRATLIVVLLVLMGEQFLAWLWGRRG